MFKLHPMKWGRSNPPPLLPILRVLFMVIAKSKHKDSEKPAKVLLDGDGSIMVECFGVEKAAKIAVRLHKRQARRMATDFMYG